MMTRERKIALIQLHIAVFLFGFTAILGELISLNPLILTWWRVLLTTAFFIIVPKYFRAIINLNALVIKRFAFVGIILALHWWTFYWAIKESNASITLVCLATTSFFTALIEPLILGTKWKKLQLMTGLIIIPGMFFIAHSVSGNYTVGICLGIASAIFAAIFPSLNKKWMGDENIVAISTVEIFSAFLSLSFVILVMSIFGEKFTFFTNKIDLFYMIILSLICTNLAFVLAFSALKHLSAFTSALSVNLEPVYGIILAAIIFHQHEDLNTGFYIGAALIILTVGLYPILAKN